MGVELLTNRDIPSVLPSSIVHHAEHLCVEQVELVANHGTPYVLPSYVKNSSCRSSVCRTSSQSWYVHLPFYYPVSIVHRAGGLYVELPANHGTPSVLPSYVYSSSCSGSVCRTSSQSWYTFTGSTIQCL